MNLEEMIDQELATVEAGVEEKEAFQVQDMNSAQWAFEQYARAHYTLEQLAEMVKARKKRLDEWLADQAEYYTQTMDRMEDLLKPYISQAVAADKKKKSVDFLGGKAGYRSTPQSVLITNEEKVLAWCEEHAPEAIKKTVRKKELTPYVKGGIVPGAELVDGTPRFYVSPDKVQEVDNGGKQNQISA